MSKHARREVNRAIGEKIAFGWEVESEDDLSAIVRRGSKVRHFWHFVLFVGTLGV